MSAAFIQSPDASADSVENLEKQLKLSLQQVQPDRDFVDHLHNRLTTPRSLTVERRKNAGFSLLLVGFSLFSGLLLIWLMRQFRTAQPEI